LAAQEDEEEEEEEEGSDDDPVQDADWLPDAQTPVRPRQLRASSARAGNQQQGDTLSAGPSSRSLGKSSGGAAGWHAMAAGSKLLAMSLLVTSILYCWLCLVLGELS
jgi:hypothetical protein